MIDEMVKLVESLLPDLQDRLYTLSSNAEYLFSRAHVLGTTDAVVYTPGHHEDRDSKPISVVREYEE